MPVIEEMSLNILQINPLLIQASECNTYITELTKH
jgi:hypothetical protein